MDIYLLAMFGVAGIILLTLLYLILEQTVLYPHTFIVYKKTNKGTSIKRTKCKEWTDKEGTRWIKLLHKKLLAPMPDEDNINITDKGKWHLEAFLYPDGQFQYITIRDDSEIDVISTNQRVMLTKQIIKAQQEKKLTLLSLIDKFGVPALFILGFVMILAVFMLFYDDALKPINEIGRQVIDAQENMLEHDKIQLQTAQTLERIENRVQLIESKTNQGSSSKGVPD